MNDSTPSKGIFHGTDEIISSFLGLGSGKTLKQLSTYRRLSPAGKGTSDFETLVSNLYREIEKNRSDHTPSKENWRSEGQTTLDPNNRSPEVLLERAIAILGEREILKGWFNQVPVASGLVDGWADRRAAIDLVHHRNDCATFVELKWESDTPAFAAFEILLYGLAYLFCYVHRQAFGYESKKLMKVKKVSLRVLAPHPYFENSDLTWMGQGLDEGIQTLASTKANDALSMDFGFLAFPSSFRLPFETGEGVLTMRDLQKDDEECRLLVSAISNLDTVWRHGETTTL